MNPADIQKALDEGRALLVDAEGCDYSWEPKVQRLVAALEAVSREKNEWQARAESAESLMKLEGNIQRLQGELQETKGTLPSEQGRGANELRVLREEVEQLYGLSLISQTTYERFIVALSPGSAPPQNTAQPSKPKPSMPCAICGERRDLHALPMQCPESMKEWSVVTVFTPAAVPREQNAPASEER
jgi:hypothetical protein